MTFTVRPCHCTWWGDQLIVDADDSGSGRVAYQDCQICAGAGATC